MYRATRGGEEVYAGGVDGLLEAARNGQILANDLIFDPTVEKWIFARSLSVLAGFPLKGRRSGSPAAAPAKSKIVLNESTLRERDRRQQAVVRVAGLALVLGSLAFLIMQIPSRVQQSSSEMDELITDGELNRLKIEGTGVGLEGGATQSNVRSNMDGEDVVVRGEYDPSAPNTAGGRRAQLEDTSEPGAETSQNSDGLDAADDVQPRSPVNGEPATAVIRTGSAAATDQNPEGTLTRTVRHERLRERKIVDLPSPKVSSPDTFTRKAPETGVRTTIRDSSTTADAVQRELSSVSDILENAKENRGPETQRELLQAAKRADRIFKYLDDKPGAKQQLEDTETLLKQLREAFRQLCEKEADPQFCTLKVKHPQWPDVVIRSIANQRALVGMSREQLVSAWGNPRSRLEAEKATVLCFDAACARSARLVGEMVVEVREGELEP